MHDPLDIFLKDDPSPERRRELQARLAEDADLRRRLLGMIHVVDDLRSQWDEVLPDRRVIVLHALQAMGRADLLTDADLQLLEANASRIEQLESRFSSAGDLQRRIEQDCRAFESLWDEQRRGAAPRPDRASRPRQRRRSATRWFWRIPVAAALTLFIVLSVLLIGRNADLETVATADDVRLVEFADGSTIRLMPNSRLTYVPDDRQSIVNRRATLDGRAVFDIMPQRKGFIVETPTAMTTVLGTMFAIDAGEEVTDVVLVEGRIAVANQQRKEAAVMLRPGQMSRVQGTAMPTEPHSVEMDEVLAWTGLFIFRSTSLREIAERLSLHYGVRIAVDEELSGEEITGTFDQEDPLISILRTIASAVGADVVEQNGSFAITRQ